MEVPSGLPSRKYNSDARCTQLNIAHSGNFFDLIVSERGLQNVKTSKELLSSGLAEH